MENENYKVIVGESESESEIGESRREGVLEKWKWVVKNKTVFEVGLRNWLRNIFSEPFHFNFEINSPVRCLYEAPKIANSP